MPVSFFKINGGLTRGNQCRCIAQRKLFEVARELTATLPARLAVKSKSQRGYELIDGEQVARQR